MAFDPLAHSGAEADRKPIFKRLIWMLAYWFMGVAVTGCVGFIIRLWIKA